MMAADSSPGSSLRLASVSCAESGPHRTSSRCVSWNSSGSYLAVGGSDRAARIFAVEAAPPAAGAAAAAGASAAGVSPASSSSSSSSAIRELLVVSHASAVTKVRFHPTSATQLASAAVDKVVRLWDVRGATQRSLGSLTLLSGNSPVSLEWCPTKSHLLAVTEQDGTISLYDVRMLNASATTAAPAPPTATPTSARPRPGAVSSFSTGEDLPDACIFSPCGRYLLSDSNVEGMGRIRVWKAGDGSGPSTTSAASQPSRAAPVVSYPSHAPLYALSFSPDGSCLATGGADAVVGMWDGSAMICHRAVARHTKYIRSVAYTPDSKILASASEEIIDLADAADGSLIGQVSSSGQKGSRPTGAEDIAFHPKESYVLACARSDGPLSPTPLSVLRLAVGSHHPEPQ